MKHHCLLTALLLSLPAAVSADESAVTIKRDERSVALSIGGKLVTRYHHGAEVAKPYFWPMIAPNGAAVTRAWPMEKGAAKETTDHVHQKSAWFCHGDVIPEGVELTDRIRGVVGVDFWSESKGHGKMVVRKLETEATGRIVTENEWQTSAGQPILVEKRTITLRKAATGLLISVTCELQASVCPVVFGDTKEGSFGVRVNDEMRLSAGNAANRLVNSRGSTGEKACWGFQADWCDYSGTVQGKHAGIAVFDDPANAHRACWHARGYGLLAANPFGRDRSGFPQRKGEIDLVRIAKGDKLLLRYGIYLHDGDAQTGQVAAAFKEFTTK